MNRIVKKICQLIRAVPVKGINGKVFNYLNVSRYMNYYIKYLKSLGIVIDGIPKFIASDVYFDGNDYSKIYLGNNITISREVMFLSHDYSITTAMVSLGKRINRGEGELYFSKPIVINEDVFIGARVSLLPGTVIGRGSIIGAGSVVRGEIPAGSIVVGNPAKVVGSVEKFAKKHMQIKDYYVEDYK